LGVDSGIKERGSALSSGEVAALMFGTFAVLIILRVPASFALGLACISVSTADDRLSPSRLMSEM
jgi:hypothetical protein